MKVCVDASALLGIALCEPDRDSLLDAIMSAPVRVMSPVNYWESMVRVRRLFGDAGAASLQDLIEALPIQIEAATGEHAKVAAEAFAKFGMGHPARLNLGDCFAYALAVSEGAPLVFKGNDFPKTDVLRVFEGNDNYKK